MRKKFRKKFREWFFKRQKHHRFSPTLFEPLEPRVLLSATFTAAEMDAADDSLSALPVLECQIDSDMNNLLKDTCNIQYQTTLESEKSLDITEQSLIQELIIIDSSVSDYESIVDELLANQSEARIFTVHILDSEQDGILEISSILSNYENLSAIHVFSHGSSGLVGCTQERSLDAARSCT